MPETFDMFMFQPGIPYPHMKTSSHVHSGQRYVPSRRFTARGGSISETSENEKYSRLYQSGRSRCICQANTKTLDDDAAAPPSFCLAREAWAARHHRRHRVWTHRDHLSIHLVCPRPNRVSGEPTYDHHSVTFQGTNLIHLAAATNKTLKLDGES